MPRTKRTSYLYLRLEVIQSRRSAIAVALSEGPAVGGSVMKYRAKYVMTYGEIMWTTDELYFE